MCYSSIRPLFFILVIVLISSTMLFGQRMPNEHYFYGLVVEGKPYVFVKDSDRMKTIQNLLIEGQISTQQQFDSLGKNLEIEGTRPHIFRNLMLATENIARIEAYVKSFTYYPMMKGLENLKYIIPLPGDKVTIQVFSNDNSGIKSVVTIDSIFYSLDGELLLTCSKLATEDSLAILSASRPTLPVLTTVWRRDEFGNKRVSQDIPTLVEQKRLGLVHELNEAMSEYRFRKPAEASIQPFLITERDKGTRKKVAQIHYAIAVYSCCYQRRSRGYVVIIDRFGEELWRSEPGSYYESISISDVNDDGDNEVLFVPLNGDFFINLMIPDRDQHSGKFIMRNVLEHRLPLDYDSGC